MAILLVEDDTISRTLLTRILTGRGFDVRSAAGAREALSLGAEFPPDALVCDWLLKDIYTGLEVAEAIQNSNPEIPVFFVSGLPAHTLEPRVQHIRHCHVIEKPFHHDDLIAMIQQALPAQASSA